MKATFVAGIMALGLCMGASAASPTFTLSSPDLPAGKPIADKFTADAWGCHGGNESPVLQWANAPAGTKSFALLMFDPYRPPSSGWWHWVVYDIPASSKELPHNAGQPGNSGMPQGAKQAKADGEAPEAHYYGPCPDAGDPPHHYTFTVYALSVDHLDVPATSTPANIEATLLPKTLAKASIVRLFSRPKT